MGDRGPAPKPTRLRVLDGNPGKRPLPVNEPHPDPISDLTPTDWLSEDAKDEWNRVAPELKKLGLLTQIDRSALEAYCMAYARWKQAEEMLKKGWTFETEAGYIAQHPAVGIANKAMDQIRAFCKEFGLTPSARSRMSLPGEKEDEDELEKLLAGS